MKILSVTVSNYFENKTAVISIGGPPDSKKISITRIDKGVANTYKVKPIISDCMKAAKSLQRFIDGQDGTPSEIMEVYNIFDKIADIKRK